VKVNNDTENAAHFAKHERFILIVVE